MHQVRDAHGQVFAGHHAKIIQRPADLFLELFAGTPRLKVNDTKPSLINILDPVTEQFVFDMIIIPVAFNDIGILQGIDAGADL